jgi:hypothetical protein
VTFRTRSTCSDSQTRYGRVGLAGAAEAPRAAGRATGVVVAELEATEDGRGIGFDADAGAADVEGDGEGTGREDEAVGAADRAAAADADALAEADGAAGVEVGVDSAFTSAGPAVASEIALAWAARRAGFGERVPSAASGGVEGPDEASAAASEEGVDGAPPASAWRRRRRT